MQTRAIAVPLALLVALAPVAALAHDEDARPGRDVSEHGRGNEKRCAATLRPKVRAALDALGVPGAIVDVDVPGVCRWRETFGVGDLAAGRPVRLPDHFRVGSITKTFTGTAVLQLVDEKRVGLDDPVSRHLDGVPNGDHITVRQLLYMSSGLYNYSEDAAFNASLDARPDRVWSIDELLAIAFAHEPYFQPGGGFHYSNTNTLLLGRIVESVTQAPLAQELEDRIFRPLGMHHTSLPALDDASLPHPFSRGYMFGTNVGTLDGRCDADTTGIRDVTHASASWTWAAGGAVSTARDLATWTRALAEGTLLTEETQAERLRWIPTSPAPGAPRYGLHVTDFAGLVGHDGALPGYQTFMAYVPASRATLVILTNVFPDANCGGPADALARLVAGELNLFSAR